MNALFELWYAMAYQARPSLQDAFEAGQSAGMADPEGLVAAQLDVDLSRVIH